MGIMLASHQTCKSCPSTGALANIIFPFRESFQKSDVNISVLPQRIVLYFGSKPGSISLDLFEATCEQKKYGLQELLFKLADNIKTLERQLSGK